MHWNNGRFHESVTVGNKVFMTDHKHIAIFGTKDYTGYGESGINSYMYGKDIGIIANNKFYSDSNSGSNLWSKQYIHIEAGSNYANHGSDNGTGIEIVSKNGPAILSAESNSATIRSNNNSVNINAGTYVNLNGGSGIVINNTSYGTSLPTSGNTEGRVYFKLIS